MSETGPILVCSARPDGATTGAVGLAAVLSIEKRRCLLGDLNPDRPELATLLDVPASPSVFDLASVPRMAPLSRSELEEHVRWRDGIGVLTGVQDPGQAEKPRGPFLESLLALAEKSFDHVVLDIGRLRPEITLPAGRAVILVVARPTAVGICALEAALQALIDAECPWRQRIRVVLNRVREDSIKGIPEMLAGYYGVEVGGHLPDTPAYWETAERECSPRALCVPIPDRRRHVRIYGREALVAREALERLARSVTTNSRQEAPLVKA